MFLRVESLNTNMKKVISIDIDAKKPTNIHISGAPRFSARHWLDLLNVLLSEGNTQLANYFHLWISFSRIFMVNIRQIRDQLRFADITRD